MNPSYARTLEKGATHSSLIKFYKDLHTSLGQPVTNAFITFIKPEYAGVSEELFSGVKEDYGKEMLKAVSDLAEDHIDDVRKLTNLMLPELQTVLARQRKDYGINQDEYEMEYPIFEQAENIDETPVHNIGMERQCGKVDYRLKKFRTIASTSRSLILQRSKQLREGTTTSFRGFKDIAQAKKDLELEWLKSTKEKFEKGADQKQEVAQRMERKRLNMLDTLKSSGGPFTVSQEVEIFLKDNNLDDRAKQKRLKMEIQFARESSTLLPSVDPIFKIMVTQPNGKRRMKTAIKFGEALASFLGKKSDRTTLEYSKFQDTLN